MGIEIKPAPNQILIKVEKMDETKEGIILPDDKLIKEKSKILAIGDDVKGYKVGDLILYKSWAVDLVQISDDEEHCFIEQDKVLGKIK